MPAIETNSFSIEFPNSWTHGHSKRGASLNGPSGEVVILQSILIHGNGKKEQLQNVKDALIHNAEETMQSAIKDPNLEIVEKLKNEVLKNGSDMVSLHLKSVDGDTVFSEYSIAGPSNLIYITFEASTEKDSSRAIVEESIHNMVFANNSPNKPWWKFW